LIPPVAAIVSWPLIVWAVTRGRAPQIIVIVSVLGGYMFLPTQGGIDLPGAGMLDKFTVPVLTALLLCTLTMPKDLEKAMIQPGWRPTDPLANILIFTLFAGTVMTVLTNQDGFFSFDFYAPGLRIYDAAAAILSAIYMLLPMLLARKFLAHPDMQRLLLKALCVAGLIYTPLILFELRMSPQVNNIVYGFFPHAFEQHIRASGYRPLVFFNHGLLLSIFLTATVIAAVGLARFSEGKARTRYLAAAVLLFAMLVLSKSLGALIIAVLLCPIVMFLPLRLQVLAAAVIALIVLSYPIARGMHIIPVDWLLGQAEAISAQRAESLAFRMNFEELLLVRAEERPVFGWGGYGRAMLTDRATIPDGEWIIVFGRDGWAGFLAKFGLMVFPIVLIWWRAKRDGIGMESAVIAVALTAGLIDLIPNSGMTPDKWLLAGALWGRLELGRVTDATHEAPEPPPLRFGRRRRAQAAPAIDAPGGPISIYTRQRQRIDRTERAKRRGRGAQRT
jgi:hypothetical protein